MHTHRHTHTEIFPSLDQRKYLEVLGSSQSHPPPILTSSGYFISYISCFCCSFQSWVSVLKTPIFRKFTKQITASREIARKFVYRTWKQLHTQIQINAYSIIHFGQNKISSANGESSTIPLNYQQFFVVAHVSSVSQLKIFWFFNFTEQITILRTLPETEYVLPGQVKSIEVDAKTDPELTLSYNWSFTDYENKTTLNHTEMEESEYFSFNSNNKQINIIAEKLEGSNVYSVLGTYKVVIWHMFESKEIVTTVKTDSAILPPTGNTNCNLFTWGLFAKKSRLVISVND